MTAKKKKPPPRLEPPRLKALRAGETVELPNQGWRKGGFYDLRTEKDTLRIECIEAKGDKALIRLARQEKLRYPKASYSQGNYTNVPALGLEGAGASVPEDVQEAQSLEAQAKDALRLADRRSLAERVAALEGKARPQQLASLRRRIQALERATGEKAA